MSSGIIITNNETKDITKAIISLENVWLANNTNIFKMEKQMISQNQLNPSDAAFLIKGVSEAVKNEVKKQKVRFLGMLAAALGSSLMESILSGKGIIRGGDGVIRTGKGVI